MQIRQECPADRDAIRAITEAAFRNVEHSSQTEAAIVESLRAAGALTLSLVAVDGDDTVGHVAFSPVAIDGAQTGWLGLGPVSVRPDRQRRGIGQALIREGLAQLKHRGAQGCVVLGAPEYYGRFGFRSGPDLRLNGVPPHYFQRLAFVEPVPAGEISYHRAFDAT